MSCCPGNARSVAPMVEGAVVVALRCYDTDGGTLAVSRLQAGQANDHPPVEPSVSPGGQCGRDQKGRDAACVAPQLRHPPARARDIRIIQALLGHNKLDTTARYTRVATGMIAGIESPLDLLSQPRKKPKKSRRDPPPA